MPIDLNEPRLAATFTMLTTFTKKADDFWWDASLGDVESIPVMSTPADGTRNAPFLFEYEQTRLRSLAQTSKLACDAMQAGDGWHQNFYGIVLRNEMT